MLTVEQNEELTSVGPGTPMGELLRCYWYPIAFEEDFDSVPTKTVRLLGENWTLFKTPKGCRTLPPSPCFFDLRGSTRRWNSVRIPRVEV